VLVPYENVVLSTCWFTRPNHSRETLCRWLQLGYLEGDAVLGWDLITSDNLLIGLAHEVLVLPEKYHISQARL